MSTDLKSLSDEELAATFLVLGERAQCISNAQAAIRREIQFRSRAPEETRELLAEEITALDEAVAGAPEMLAKLKELEDARKAAIASAEAEAEAAKALEIAQQEAAAKGVK